MDKPVPLAMIRSQADLDEKCLESTAVVLKPDQHHESALETDQDKTERLGKIFRNVRFVVVDSKVQ